MCVLYYYFYTLTILILICLNIVKLHSGKKGIAGKIKRGLSTFSIAGSKGQNKRIFSRKESESSKLRAHYSEDDSLDEETINSDVR